VAPTRRQHGSWCVGARGLAHLDDVSHPHPACWAAAI
jgi:hypothetical protein